jgi:hypothetical protein
LGIQNIKSSDLYEVRQGKAPEQLTGHQIKRFAASQ